MMNHKAPRIIDVQHLRKTFRNRHCSFLLRTVIDPPLQAVIDPFSLRAVIASEAKQSKHFYGLLQHYVLRNDGPEGGKNNRWKNQHLQVRGIYL